MKREQDRRGGDRGRGRGEAPSRSVTTLRDIADLARQGRGSATFRAAEDEPPLEKGEILVIVADEAGVVARSLHVPGSEGPRPHGTATLDRLATRVAEIQLAAEEVLPYASPLPQSDPSGLTAAERAVLKEGGFDLDAWRPLAPEEDPFVRTRALFALIVADSYTVEQAAKALGVNGSRIRQRLTGTPRTLYGFKLGSSWRIPKFQFRGKRLVHNIEKVIAQLQPREHPVGVHNWFTHPDPDLELADAAVSPVEWLERGGDPELPAKIASDLINYM